MKIKSKRHPDRKTEEIYFKHQTMSVIPKSIWDMKPIDPADFLPMPPPISAVELQETVDLLQRGIISRGQYFDQIVKSNHELMTQLTK